MLGGFVVKHVTLAVGALVLAVFIGAYFFFSGPSEPAGEFVEVKKGDVIQTVSVTGRVRASEDVSLSFESAGKIAGIFVKTGERVKKGRILMELENSELKAALSEAEASVAVEKAKLAELLRGTRAEEILIQEIKVENAKTALRNSEENLLDKLNDAYVKSDSGIRSKTDQLFSSPKTSPELNINVGYELEGRLEFGRLNLEGLLAKWSDEIRNASNSSDLFSLVSLSKSYLGNVRQYFDDASLALGNLSPTASLSQTTIDAYRADIASARADVITSTSNLTSAEEKLRTAYSTLSVEESTLALKKAGATEESIAEQEAAVLKSEAGLKSKLAGLEKTRLYAPFDGVVTGIEPDLGEVFGSREAVLSLISDARLEIEADVPEVDVVKLSVGLASEVTLDAYGETEKFQAELTEIEPAATIIDGVPTYKTAFRFLADDARIRPGMTADIEVVTARRGGVLKIPARTVNTDNGVKSVKILEAGKIVVREVKVGLAGSDGSVEIIGGLKEGEVVLLYGAN